MEYFNTILQAVVFAAEAHKGQVRKYTGLPYINHPISVASRVEAVRGDSQMIMAALLHDTLEDTKATASDIKQLFGVVVASYVIALSDMEQGNRAERKAQSRIRLAAAPAEVKTIKLADLLDNTEDITLHDPKFARVYMAEKAALLPALQGGNELLWKQAEAQIARYHASL